MSADTPASLAIFVINMDGSTARMDEADRQLRAAGLSYERFPAYDGRGKPPEHVRAYDPARATSYFGRRLNGGEIGCYMSHLGCARRFLDSGAAYGLVLEDDVEILPEGVARLHRLVDWLAAHPQMTWDLANLGRAPKKFLRPLADLGGATLVRANYFPTTTHALLWSRAGATRFLADHDRIYAPVDHFLRYWCGKTGQGLATRPPLFLPRGEQSEIDTDKVNGARSKSGRNALYFWREFRRQSRNYINAVHHLILSRG